MNRSGSNAGQFAAIMAHDLESSLLVLSANAELLREIGPRLSREQSGYLAEIERTARRMKRLLTRIRTDSESRVELELMSA
jgi:signal transduction histidine kinase